MASKRHQRRRACEGKVRHVTLESAIKASRLLYRAKVDPSLPSSMHYDAYHCRTCGGYHTGHRPAAIQRAIDGRRAGSSR